MGTPRPTDPLSGEWLLLFVLSAIAVLAWVRSLSPRKWKLVWESVFRMRLGRQTMREDLNLRDRTLIALVAVASVCTGLFLLQVAAWGGVAHIGWLAALEAMVAVFVITGLQLLLLRAIGFLFQGDGGIEEYGFTLVLLLIGCGLMLLPLVVLFAYRPTLRTLLAVAGLLLVGAMLVWRWVRAWRIASGSGTSSGYALLYICALEILPFALLLNSLRATLPTDLRPH
jgi:hypothetical protein